MINGERLMINSLFIRALYSEKKSLQMLFVVVNDGLECAE